MLKYKKNKKNSLTIHVPDCKGTRFVISDIHGCIKTFKALVEKINLTKKDQLFLLGDYIDRGKDARAVIDYIFELISNDYQIIPLIGNHEDTLRSNEKIIITDGEVKYSENDDKSTLYNANHEIEKRYIDFISELPYFIELENCFLVHAGFEFDIEIPFNFSDAMLWIRGWTYDAKKARNKPVIYGHTPKNLEQIKRNIEINAKQIPLDNGCVFSDEVGYGNLLCLNLNNYSLTIQPNIDDEISANTN